ncbi:MAG: alpha-amylase family glycosyl hydrolase [Candidatus Gastranaerophilales bacterium]|nr:alpha-amylase family glycosyl hydrolase [Candidatus Gastranaerophilales bacterium]
MNIVNGSSFNHNKKNEVSFGGQKKFVDNYGAVQQKFFLPYDTDKYSAKLELYRVAKDKNGDYSLASKEPIAFSLNEKGEAPNVAPDKLFGDKTEAFAYRYVLTDKNDENNKKFAFDPGYVIEDKRIEHSDDAAKLNVVLNNGAVINRPGKMQLVMLDQYNPGYTREKDGKISYSEALRANALASTRTHTNKLGGNFAGLIQKLDKLEKEGYTRIVGMPVTKDTVSSHLYWTQNAYQLAPQLGDMNDYKDLQKEMFKRGINWVSDAALVNEGLEGIHFTDVLKWGKDSPFYNWFKINGLNDGVMAMGVLPKQADYLGYKVVNSPFELGNTSKANKEYDVKKPTYVQFFDTRLADKKQMTDNNLINTYAKNNTDNNYDITAHDDTVYPYSFEVKPEQLKQNIDKYIALNGKDASLQSMDAVKNIMQFDNFKIDQKNEGGFVAWDGNVDIAKLNFSYGTEDVKKYVDSLPKEERKEAMEAMEEGVWAVQDYALSSGKYWTQLTADTTTSYAASLLRGVKEPSAKAYMQKIQDEVKAGNLPKSSIEAMTSPVIRNIINGRYESKTLESNDTVINTLAKKIMDYPLEALPANNDLLAVLTSPYIAKRASNKDELGVSRFDLYQKGNPNLKPKYQQIYDKADSFLANDIASFSIKILKGLGMDLSDGSSPNALGKFVIKDVMDDVTQYALIKSIAPNAPIEFDKNGELDLSKINPADITLGSLGIDMNSPEENADALIDKMSENFAKISDEDKKELTAALKKRLKGADVNSYLLAEALVDRTETGLNWRIDAAKDVAPIDSVRNGTDGAGETFDKAIDFWKAYNKAVTEVNPHSYTAAEITDLEQLFNKNPDGRFSGPWDAEAKFIRDTGITTTANYTYFFSSVPELFNKSAETGETNSKYGNPVETRKNLIEGWSENPGFFYQTPLEGVLHSYTFVGNHDKPRILHSLALDMGLFYSPMTDANDQKIAAEVLGKDDISINYDKVSSPAIAMGKALKDGLAQAAADKSLKNTLNDDIKASLDKAIAEIASGKFKGEKFKPDAFGARPVDKALDNVFEQAKSNGLKINEKDEKIIKDAVFNNVMKPAFEKNYSIYKMMVTLPGDVTDFGGDKIGTTGYETKAKNYYQQNRNTLVWERTDPKNQKYYNEEVAKYEKKMNAILDYRNKPELAPLNDGIPVSLPMDNDTYSVLRYNDKGQAVITAYSLAGLSVNAHDSIKREEVNLDSIRLDGGSENYNHADGDQIKTAKNRAPKEGLAGGLTEGTIFKSTNLADKDRTFVVAKEGGHYVLKAEDGGKITIRPDDYNSLVLYKAE